MKKILATVISLLCITSTAFAEDTPTLKEALENSIYVSDISVYSDNEIDTSILDAFEIEIIPNTVMPFYRGDLLDIAESGVIEVTPDEKDGDPVYVALVNHLNTNSFAGEIEFCIHGNVLEMLSYGPMNSKEFALDFSTNADAVIQSLEEEKVSADGISAKLLWLEGAGYSILIENEEGQYLTSIGMQQSNSPLPSAKIASPGGASYKSVDTITGEELIQYAKKYSDYIETLDIELPENNENPLTGGSSKTDVSN